MMYDKLIRELTCCPDAEYGCSRCEYSSYLGCREHLMKQAANAIECLNSQIANEYIVHKAIHRNLSARIPRWIPVTERLPECEWGSEVGNIEWISRGMVFAGCFGRGGKYRDAYFRTWTDGTEGIDAKGADYWRAVTLPAPPKEET